MAPPRLNNSVNADPKLLQYRNCLIKIDKVLKQVQSEDGSNAKQYEKLIKEALKICDEFGVETFSNTIMRMLLIPFQSRSNNVFATRLINFFYDLISAERWKKPGPEGENNSPDESFSSVNTINSTMTDEFSDSDSLPLQILRHCVKYSQESRLNVRLKLVETMSKIIPDVLPVSSLRKNQRVKVIRALNVRSKDKSEHVRAAATKVLANFLEEGAVLYSEVFDVVVGRMTYDPSPAVRVAAVSSALINGNDDLVSPIVEASGDPDPNVRAAALKRITNDIKLSALTFEMREAILKANSSSDNPKSVQKALSTLLMKWLDDVKQDPCELIRIINVRRRPKVCRTALEILYNQPPEEAFEKLYKSVLNEKKYPDESLCFEITFLWLYMHQKFKDEPYIFQKLALGANEMIEYILEYVDVIEDEGDLSPTDLDFRSWMLGDLIQILGHLPNEEGERQAVLKFLPRLFQSKKLIDVRNSALAVQLISLCSDIAEETHVIELVNSVLDSDRSRIRNRRSSIKMEIDENQPASEDRVRDLEIKMASLRHQTKKFERDRDIAAKAGQLIKAQEYHDQIVKLEKEIEDIKKEIDQHENLSQSTSMVMEDEEGEQWEFSDKTMLIATSVVKSNILLANKISDFSRTFYELYAPNAVEKCKDPVVRCQALELMCIVALDIESECMKASAFCLAGLLRDTDAVKITALKCIFDLVLRYSFAQIGEYPQIQQILMGHVDQSPEFQALLGKSNNTKKLLEKPGGLFKSLILSYVMPQKNINPRLPQIAVAGILKLLFRKELQGTIKIITQLLVHWATPVEDMQCRDLDILLPTYVTLGETEVEEVVASLFQSIRSTLMEIRSTSDDYRAQPHADLGRIINLIVKATDPGRLGNFQRPYIGHEKIAEQALEEIRKIDLSNEEKLHYAKLLKVLNLRACTPESINRMKHTVTEILELVQRPVHTIMSGFAKYLEDIGRGGDGNIGNNESDEEAVFDETQC